MKWDSVLVVDDDKAFCALMASHLHRHGYEVESCQNAVDALEVLRAKGPFQVMVTDISMPGMSGIELLRAARRVDPNLEVIIITAAGSLESAIAAMREDGAFDYLLKPLDMMSALSLSVGRAMTHRRLNSEREALRAHLFTEAERLRILAANVGEAVIIADANGMLTLVNPPALRLLERPVQEGLEMFTNLPQPLVDLVSRWQAEGSHQAAATELPWPNGAVLKVSLLPVRAADKTRNGWVMIIRGAR